MQTCGRWKAYLFMNLELSHNCQRYWSCYCFLLRNKKGLRLATCYCLALLCVSCQMCCLIDSRSVSMLHQTQSFVVALVERPTHVLIILHLHSLYRYPKAHLGKSQCDKIEQNVHFHAVCTWISYIVNILHWCFISIFIATLTRVNLNEDYHKCPGWTMQGGV